MLTRAQRDQWAEELESGKWKQHHYPVAWKEGDDSGEWPAAFCDCALMVLSTAVLKGDPITELTDQQAIDFTLMNDVDRLPFPEIAKHVRELPVSD